VAEGDFACSIGGQWTFGQPANMTSTLSVNGAGFQGSAALAIGGRTYETLNSAGTVIQLYNSGASDYGSLNQVATGTNSVWGFGGSTNGSTAHLTALAFDTLGNAFSNAGMTFGGTTPATVAAGETAWKKITAAGTAPGAGFLKIEAVAGTSGGTCKIIAYAGTSTTPVTIVDNVGAGC
jgi:hypothetical protein